MAVKHIKAMRLKNYQSRVYGLFPQKGCLFKKFGKLLSCLILFRRARPLSMLLCGRKSPFLVQGPLPFISRNSLYSALSVLLGLLAGLTLSLFSSFFSSFIISLAVSCSPASANVAATISFSIFLASFFMSSSFLGNTVNKSSTFKAPDKKLSLNN